MTLFVRIFLVFILIVGATLTSTAQVSPHSISGIILNAADSTPVSYAHVSIPSQQIGVMANEDGAFQLNFEAISLFDTLRISHLGFEAYAQAVNRIDTASVRYFLRPDVYALSEIIITPREDSSKLIVRAALKRLKENYPVKPFQMTAFYREKAQSRDNYAYTQLMEAAIAIQDPGVNDPPENIKIRLDQFRKSNDLADYSLMQKIWKRLLGEQNNLYGILIQDPVRNLKFNNIDDLISSYCLECLLDKAVWWLSGTTSMNNEPVYQVNFVFNSGSGKLFINQADLGFYRIEYNLESRWNLSDEGLSDQQKKVFNEAKYGTEQFNYQGDLNGRIVVNYQKIKGKYYPSFIEWLQLGNYRKSNIEGKSRTIGYNTCTLMVTAIETNKKEMTRLKKRQVVNRENPLGAMSKEYDPKFWAGYNTLLLTPLEEKLIKDLEFESSLEEQFSENSNGNKR